MVRKMAGDPDDPSRRLTTDRLQEVYPFPRYPGDVFERLTKVLCAGGEEWQMVERTRQAFVLSCRLGGAILDEVAGLLGISRGRVRDIEGKALRRLRHPTKRDLLVRSFPPDHLLLTWVYGRREWWQDKGGRIDSPLWDGVGTPRGSDMARLHLEHRYRATTAHGDDPAPYEVWGMAEPPPRDLEDLEEQTDADEEEDRAGVDVAGPEYLTYGEAQAMLRVGKTTLKRICSEQGIPLLAVRGQYRVRRLDLQDYLDRQAGAKAV